MPGSLGRFLAERTERTRPWSRAMVAALATVAVLGLVIPNHHPHFGFDAWPLFWPAFGLGLGAALIFLAKKVVQPIIKRPEDHYGDL
jgi:peptidoglycan/LPS O-acetylase OafA/YrhL